ncbi:MAG: hypothetical protein Q8Q33_01740 [Chlamydiota bacterium]|nr:hypothetical protein [Chlamydiota bacterium]
MSIVDNLRSLSNSMLILFIASRFLIGLGLGIILAPYLKSLGLIILILGIVLAIPDTYKVIKKK